MSVGGNYAVQMNENAPARPAIDKDLPFKPPVLAIRPAYVGVYS